MKKLTGLFSAVMVLSMFGVAAAKAESSNGNDDRSIQSAKSIAIGIEHDLAVTQIYSSGGGLFANKRERDRQLCNALGGFVARVEGIEVVLSGVHQQQLFQLALDMYSRSSEAALYCSALNSYNGDRSELEKHLTAANSAFVAFKRALSEASN